MTTDQPWRNDFMGGVDDLVCFTHQLSPHVCDSVALDDDHPIAQIAVAAVLLCNDM
jgi:hypothetical protein